MINQGANRNGAAVQQRVVKCDNCQEKGHFGSIVYQAKKAQEFSIVEGKDIADKRFGEIPTPAAFQTDDLYAFDFDYDVAPSAKEVLMANLSSYDSDVLSEIHVALSVTDSEETLKLAEESRLKMLAKQNDPSLKKHKVNLKLIDYVALNKLSEHFAKHFVPQKQLSAEQAYWLPMSQPVVVKPPVPSKLILKKEIPRSEQRNQKIKADFNQMETEVAKCFVDKKYFEIEKKESSLDNDRLLELIICQDVMNVVMHANNHHDNVLLANNNSLVHDNSALDRLKHKNDRLMKLLISQDLVHIVVNSLATINDYKSMEQSYVDKYEENLKFQTELAKKNDMINKAVYNELSN
nr:hypothetical protein [Tanacetum cinerariifolium]